MQRAIITRDEVSGDVTLSTRPSTKTWDEFFAFLKSIDIPEDFLAERPMNVLPSAQGIFNDAEPSAF